MKAHSFSKANTKLLGSLGKEVRRLRKLKKFTIEQLAEKAELHYKYVQTIEQGQRNVSLSVFVRLSEALGLSPAKLLNNISS